MPGVVLLGGTGAVALIVLLGAALFAVNPSEPRDRPLPPPALAPGAPLRLVVLGTSLSAAGRYSWPDLVAGELATRTGLAVQMTRIARAGATSEWGLTQTEDVLAAMPDVVLLEFSMNDADLRDGLPLARSREVHEQILRRLRQSTSASVLLLTMNPASGVRSWMRPFLSRYYAMYTGLAERHKTGLVDLYAYWLRLPPDRRGMRDGLHPGDQEASSIIVEPVVGSLIAAVCAARDC